VEVSQLIIYSRMKDKVKRRSQLMIYDNPVFLPGRPTFRTVNGALLISGAPMRDLVPGQINPP